MLIRPVEQKVKIPPPWLKKKQLIRTRTAEQINFLYEIFHCKPLPGPMCTFAAST